MRNQDCGAVAEDAIVLAILRSRAIPLKSHARNMAPLGKMPTIMCSRDRLDSKSRWKNQTILQGGPSGRGKTPVEFYLCCSATLPGQ